MSEIQDLYGNAVAFEVDGDGELCVTLYSQDGKAYFNDETARALRAEIDAYLDGADG